MPGLIEKHWWTPFWYSVTVLTKQYGRKYRSSTSVKILVFIYVGQNLGRVWRVRVRRRRSMTNTLGQKGLLINSDVQNGRRVCLDWVHRQVRKGFVLDLHKGGREHEWRLAVLNFFGIKIGAGLKEDLDIKWVGWIVLEVGVRFLRLVKA